MHDLGLRLLLLYRGSLELVRTLKLLATIEKLGILIDGKIFFLFLSSSRGVIDDLFDNFGAGIFVSLFNHFLSHF